MKVVDFIVCDDIRDEVTGKRMFIGVYDGFGVNALPNVTFPLRIKLAFYARIKLDAGEKVPSGLTRLEFLSSGSVFHSIEGDFSEPLSRAKPDQNYFAYAFIITQFPLPETDKIDFKLAFGPKNAPVLELVPDYSLKVTISRVATGKPNT